MTSKEACVTVTSIWAGLNKMITTRRISKNISRLCCLKFDLGLGWIASWAVV